MEPFKLESSWEEVKEQLKEINININDDDLAYEPGGEDELLSRLQQKMSGSKEEIKGVIESLSANKGKAG